MLNSKLLVPLALVGLAAVPASAAAADDATDGIEARMHVVPVPIASYRLLAMNQDDEGAIWVGSIHRQIHRYDPRAGRLDTIPLPYDSSASTCLCVGSKVYVLGQTYPRLIIYDRENQSFQEIDYPTDRPDVWYGAGPVDDRYLYLFDRGSGVVIKWDTTTDTGAVIPFPFDAPPPGGGLLDPASRAIWCRSFRIDEDGRYVDFSLARFDLDTDRFTDHWLYPSLDDVEGLEPDDGDPDRNLYLQETHSGRLWPFDTRAQAWRRPIAVPQAGELFGFMGGPIRHNSRLYYSLSTYIGGDLGCDGEPFHFLNAMLEFDPATRAFRFPTLTVEGSNAYYQIAYMLSAGGEFFATGSNIREPDGSLNRDRAGEVVFWQTLRPDPSLLPGTHDH